MANTLVSYYLMFIAFMPLSQSTLTLIRVSHLPIKQKALILGSILHFSCCLQIRSINMLLRMSFIDDGNGICKVWVQFGGLPLCVVLVIQSN
jgi:hypothetical protein